jgi:tRNA (guanine37-N1)-methyltransferase
MKGALKTRLKDKLEPNELRFLCTSYDIVGDIAVIRVPETLKLRTQTIAEALLQTQKHIRTVLLQISPVAGDFRLRDLEWVAGEKKTETVHKEFGCSFKVDLGKCYFSPRLSFERMRIAKLIQPNEVVVNMFAGVGCYSIIIAKHSCLEKIYSIDINPTAIQFLKENARLNRVEMRVLPILGDAKETIERRLQRMSDRIIMPLPEKAYEYVETALQALKPSGGVIHYYDFEHSAKDENVIEKTGKKVSEKLKSIGVDFDISSSRVVRTTGPNWHQAALDIKIS